MNATNQSLSIRWQIFLNLSTAEIVIETCVLSLIGTISIIGNFLVIASVYRNRSLRTSTNYLALSLAITDILYPVTVVPLSVFFLIDLKTSTFKYGKEICEFQTFCFFTLISASCYTITLMAFNRFICVCKQNMYKRIFTKRRTLVMITGLWLVCFGIGIFFVKGGVSYARFSPSIATCTLSKAEKSTLEKRIGNILVGLFIGVPYLSTSYFYVKIIRKIRQHKKRVAQGTSNGNGLGNNEIKITWTLFMVLLGYLSLMLPVVVTTIVLSYNKRIPHLVSSIIPLGTASFSAINPFIYAFMNKEFKKEYIKILTCKRD